MNFTECKTGDMISADEMKQKQTTIQFIGGLYKMIIEKAAIAGTLESSDAQVMVEPGTGIDLSIESSVINQYGRQIKAAILETLERLKVTDAKVTVVDKGALDCTIKARVECAVYRSCGQSAAGLPWNSAIR